MVDISYVVDADVKTHDCHCFLIVAGDYIHAQGPSDFVADYILVFHTYSQDTPTCDWASSEINKSSVFKMATTVWLIGH